MKQTNKAPKNDSFQDSIKHLFKVLKEPEKKELESELMKITVDYKQYPKNIIDDVLKEMILLNSEDFDNGELFPIEIKSIILLKKHIEKGYNPNAFFECWSNESITDFCLIPLAKSE
ncbi:MAG: hypothetical protein JKY54_02830 [Flavobacteriales bacterium]|nr:hypothetical protein [Flavobacteriales bacterium]